MYWLFSIVQLVINPLDALLLLWSFIFITIDTLFFIISGQHIKVIQPWQTQRSPVTEIQGGQRICPGVALNSVTQGIYAALPYTVIMFLKSYFHILDIALPNIAPPQCFNSVTLSRSLLVWFEPVFLYLCQSALVVSQLLFSSNCSKLFITHPAPAARQR